MIRAREIYLDYINDWLTIKAMADSAYYISFGLDKKQIIQLVNEGRIAFNWKFHIGTFKHI
tara:strand:+ start:367 stop:549 length:183 start_codon:yes stop_codon:yes gene_type:complete